MEREPDFIKASDLVIKKLVEAGVDTFFGVTGGAAVHFFDSVDKNSDAKSIFLNHEQTHHVIFQMMHPSHRHYPYPVTMSSFSTLDVSN